MTTSILAVHNVEATFSLTAYGEQGYRHSNLIQTSFNEVKTIWFSTDLSGSVCKEINDTNIAWL